MRPDLKHFTSPRSPGVAGDLSQQLRNLPTEVAPPYDWEEFRRRGRNRKPMRTGNVITWPYAAAAAGLTAVVAAMAMLGTGADPKVDGVVENSPATTSTQSSGIERTAAQSVNGDAKAAASRALETREWLARQPEPVVVRAGSRVVVAKLEDRIAWFDDAMTDERLGGASSDQIKVLQQERARLVSSLAQVRYAETLVADGS